MTCSERLYFNAEPVAHCVAHEKHLRARRRRELARLAERNGRSSFAFAGQRVGQRECA